MKYKDKMYMSILCVLSVFDSGITSSISREISLARLKVLQSKLAQSSYTALTSSLDHSKSKITTFFVYAFSLQQHTEQLDSGNAVLEVKTQTKGYTIAVGI